MKETSITLINKENRVIELDNFSDLNVLAFDMESAAFAQCAHFYRMPFISIRAISDVIGDESQRNEFLNCFEESSKQSNIFLNKLLELL